MKLHALIKSGVSKESNLEGVYCLRKLNFGEL